MTGTQSPSESSVKQDKKERFKRAKTHGFKAKKSRKGSMAAYMVDLV